jgi:hypothetical protein
MKIGAEGTFPTVHAKKNYGFSNMSDSLEHIFYSSK